MPTDHTRPYRLWDSNGKIWVRYRYYHYLQKAHMAALVEARWAKPGAAFEVIDVRTYALLGVYKRHPTSVSFTDVKKEDNGG